MIRLSILTVVVVASVSSAFGEHDGHRVRRGAAVYPVFPTSNTIRGHVNKDPQDFINAVGANNNGYSATGGFPTNLASSYAQTSYGGAGALPSHGGSGGGGGGSYGRRKRRQAPIDTRLYTQFVDFDAEPSWSPTRQIHSFSAPQLIADIDDTPPYPLHFPNPVMVDGLLHAATATNKAHSAVFKAYTARTPYYGLNGSYQELEEDPNKIITSSSISSSVAAVNNNDTIEIDN